VSRQSVRRLWLSLHAVGSQWPKDDIKWWIKQLTCQRGHVSRLHHTRELIAGLACHSHTVRCVLPTSVADDVIKLIWNGFCLEDDDQCFQDPWTCCSQSKKLTYVVSNFIGLSSVGLISFCMHIRVLIQTAPHRSWGSWGLNLAGWSVGWSFDRPILHFSLIAVWPF